MMKSIRIKNLRSLSDTKDMELKPINILVGANSSGKSTFLRLFPLIKQSLRKKVNGPILWTGDDDDYVDFGSFKETVNNCSDEKEIKFKFKFDMHIDSKNFFYYRRNPHKNNFKNTNVNIEFSLSERQDNNFDYISKIIIKIFNYEILLEFNEEQHVEYLKINDNKYSISENNGKNRIFIGGEYTLFDISLSNLQEIALNKMNDIIKKKKVKPLEEFDKNLYNIFGMPYIAVELDSVINYYFFTNIVGLETKNKEANKKIDSDGVRQYIDRIVSNSEFNNLVMMYMTPHIYNCISRYLSQYFRNVYYIAPVRATAERYYRLRNTAVDEVDCRGKNLPIFLNSLKNTDFENFQKWTEKNLGFIIDKSVSEGHVSLKLKKSDTNNTVNLSDSGFGYSQILPIITQLWYITLINIKKELINDTPITITIEQPELHLHPALQAKLIDVIVKVMKSLEGRKNVNFVIETHSKTIIDRLGTLIYKKKIEKNDIAIFIFNKDTENLNTKIECASFDEKGYLENWPIGFFEPEEVF